MLIQEVTTWEGSPAGLEKIVEGSKQAGPIHESMGAKNPRLWRASAGGDAEEVYYSVEFDSYEAYGKYMDEMMGSEWWTGLMKFLEDEYPDLKTLGTDVYYNAI